MAVNPPPIQVPDLQDKRLQAFLQKLKDSMYLLWNQAGAGVGAVPVDGGGTGATTAAGARTNLGLGTISTQDAATVAITGGTINGTAVGGTTRAAGAFTTLSANADVTLGKTITAAGTTGAQTINKTCGSVNFAAAATSLVVTNSLVSTSSVILATVATNDATMKTVLVVAGSGSFTIHANAAATAETRVNFLVIN